MNPTTDDRCTYEDHDGRQCERSTGHPGDHLDFEFRVI